MNTQRNLPVEDSCLHYEKLKIREEGKRKEKEENDKYANREREKERNMGKRNEENKEILKYP